MNDPEYRELLIDPKNHEGELLKLDEKARFKYNCDKIIFSLRKLKRKAAAFLNKEDLRYLEEFHSNMRMYLEDFDVFAFTRSLYENRKKDQ